MRSRVRVKPRVKCGGIVTVLNLAIGIKRDSWEIMLLGHRVKCGWFVH